MLTVSVCVSSSIWVVLWGLGWVGKRDWKKRCGWKKRCEEEEEVGWRPCVKDHMCPTKSDLSQKRNEKYRRRIRIILIRFLAWNIANVCMLRPFELKFQVHHLMIGPANKEVALLKNFLRIWLVESSLNSQLKWSSELTLCVSPRKFRSIKAKQTMSR